MSLLIRPVSDLHCEFDINYELPKLETDNDTVLVLAGDIGVGKNTQTYKDFIERHTTRFRKIIYVLGNHEHYRGKFLTTHTKMWTELLDCENVQLLEKESIVINDVAFIGATLWTNMNNCNILTVEQAKNGMNDYKLIRHGPVGEPWKRHLHPHDTIGDFVNAKHFIFDEIKKQKDAGNKVVVVTHHGCSFQSIAPEFKCSNLNGAYVSELAYELMDLNEQQPELWIHGHQHNSCDYKIDGTRVIVNPRGYKTNDPTDLNSSFNPSLLIEL